MEKDFTKMLDAVKAFHEKHGFDVGTKDTKVMLYRQNLLLEELGEISQCLTKGNGNMAEEHADLFILLLGNCITMDIDMVSEFWKKMNVINQRPVKEVDGIKRVSEWKD
jgi:NTP pyrophosphatase (non-canonical NTP hydrolase)